MTKLSTRTDVFVDRSVDNSAFSKVFAKKCAFATFFAFGENDMIFIGKKTLLCSLAALLVTALACLGVFTVVETVAQSFPPLGAVVVIDAGHGGMDGGVVGVNGTSESELNLEIALLLGEILTARGVAVVYTRTSDDALSDIKREDMNMRAEIIRDSRPDCVISIHLNSYPRDASRRGVQVFYDDTGRGGAFAALMQERLNATVNYRYSKRTDLAPQSGDFFITKCASVPSIIIECGFLSNEQDEKLLKTQAFRKELCKEIAETVIFAVS